MSFISKYLTHSRFLFNCLLNFKKVRTVRNIKAFAYTSAKNVHANRPHRNMIFADIARVDLLLLKGTATLMISIFYQKELYEP